MAIASFADYLRHWKNEQGGQGEQNSKQLHRATDVSEILVDRSSPVATLGCTSSVQEEQDDQNTKQLTGAIDVSEIVVDRSAPEATLGLQLLGLRSDVTLKISLVNVGLVSAWNAEHPGHE